MNCFYTCYNRIAILVFVFYCFSLQRAEACISPKPVIYGKDTVCENSGETYRLIPSPDPYKYKLKVVVGNGNKTYFEFANYSEIKWTKPGINFIRYVYTDKNGCSDSVTKQVYVKPSDFEFNAGPDMHVCHNDTVILGLPPIKNMTYKWYDLRQYWIGMPPESETSTLKRQAIGISTRTYTIYYKVFAKDTITGCSYIDTVASIIYQRYKTNITGETGCVNDSTVYTYTTDSMPLNAIWQIEGGEFLSNNLAKSVLVKWNRIGKNTLSLKYFTGNCKDSTFIETALSGVKQPFFAGPDVVACHGDSVTLGLPPIPNCAYRWADTRYIHLGPLPNSNESYYKNIAFGLSAGDFNIYYKVNLIDTISGCKFVDTIKLTVKHRLKTNITGTVGCYRDIATFTTAILPADAYWFAEGGEIISDNKAKSILVRWNRNGNNKIILRYNHNGCTDSAVFMADVDSLTYFPIFGADSIFENTQHTYTITNLQNTVNKWIVTGGEIISETENSIIVLWGNINPDAKIIACKINEKGCRSDSAIFPILIKKRENLDLSHTFHVYPNPFKNTIYIAPVNDFSGKINIVISDMLGRIISEQNAYITLGKNALTVDVSAGGLKSGLYNISLISAQGTSNWKLVKQ